MYPSPFHKQTNLNICVFFPGNVESMRWYFKHLFSLCLFFNIRFCVSLSRNHTQKIHTGPIRKSIPKLSSFLNLKYATPLIKQNSFWISVPCFYAANPDIAQPMRAQNQPITLATSAITQNAVRFTFSPELANLKSPHSIVKHIRDSGPLGSPR